jgi:hypothetical protein
MHTGTYSDGTGPLNTTVDVYAGMMNTVNKNNTNLVFVFLEQKSI